jgi:hypothetical protein
MRALSFAGAACSGAVRAVRASEQARRRKRGVNMGKI